MAAAHTPELLARAEAYLALPVRERRLKRAALDELLSLYNAITGQRRTWCPSCEYADFFKVVADYIHQSHNPLSSATMATSKYQIASGFENETFVHEKLSEPITAANLTDEAAEFFIKNGYDKQFVLKPGAPDEESEAKPTKADLRARYKELFNEEAPKKHTVEHLTKDIETKEAEVSLANARADYEDAHGEAPDQRLGVDRLSELTTAKRAELLGGGASA
jgi:pyruvate/2-oxoacid:ferredoxin oxidoreductase beta subunit